eukprot:EC784045.1.p1 GENE.EC784045.1~~EC784045.1.p1  ORF type:complete len:71 (+),score=8.86 EC784045.1:112-324(+)
MRAARVDHTLAQQDEVISKSFHGRHGRAYLMNNVVNVSTGEREDRILITGLHNGGRYLLQSLRDSDREEV